MQPPAVMWIPDVPDAARWLARCLAYCDARGYRLVGVVEGVTGGRYEDAARMATDARGVLVVGDPSHLPADRLPRVECAAQPPGEQRPRRIS